MNNYSPPKGRQHTPVRHHEIERTGSMNGPVVASKWTPEQIEAYWSKLPPPPGKQRLKVETIAEQRKMGRV